MHRFSTSVVRGTLPTFTLQLGLVCAVVSVGDDRSDITALWARLAFSLHSIQQQEIINKYWVCQSVCVCVCVVTAKKWKKGWYKNINFGLLAAARRKPPPPPPPPLPPPPPPRLQHCYLLTSPSCVSHYCPRVIKVTGSAFTAKHAEPIRDHSFHSSLKLL